MTLAQVPSTPKLLMLGTSIYCVTSRVGPRSAFWFISLKAYTIANISHPVRTDSGITSHSWRLQLNPGNSDGNSVNLGSKIIIVLYLAHSRVLKFLHTRTFLKISAHSCFAKKFLGNCVYLKILVHWRFAELLRHSHFLEKYPRIHALLSGKQLYIHLC